MTRLMMTFAAAASLLVAGCAQVQERLPDLGNRIGNVGNTISGAFQGSSCETTSIGADTGGKSSWPAGCDNLSELDLGVGKLQYYLVKEGPEDAPSPSLQSEIVAHYEGRRAADGVIVDSSYAKGQPAQFPLSDVIIGWGAILQTMRVGDEVIVYIPSNLAYGNESRGDLIPPDTDLVFRISLRDVLGAERERQVATAPEPAPEQPAPITRAVATSGPTPAAWAANLPWLPTGPQTKRTGTGLSYVVIKSGDPAGVTPSFDSTVQVHYDGRLAETGERFDSSWERGEPATFPVNGVIQGWTEVLQIMRPGDRWLVNIPPILAYGAEGSRSGTIGPNETLMFEIHLLDVLN